MGERNGPLLELKSVEKYYGNGDQEILVLSEIDLGLYPGEILALLGPSGSGKSTLLRIATGLLLPDKGGIIYGNRPLRGINPNASLVFQNFALYPWMTVLENVEIGLKARGIGSKERRQKALRFIDMIGLDGFESAYPRELSAGMCQRVGFSRALVMEPELLCLDEPFSSLDILTAENLRRELLELWLEQKIPLRAILMVSHNIEEVVFMADRVLVLEKDPGRIIGEMRIELTHPRERKSPRFITLVDRLYTLVTRSTGVRVPSPSGVERREKIPPLPHAGIGMVNGLIELVTDRGGREDLHRLGSELLLEVDDLLPVTEAVGLLGFGHVQEGDLVLTDLGMSYAVLDTLEQKEVFRRQALPIPLISLIMKVLEDKRNRHMAIRFFLELLEKQFSPGESRAQLERAIDWGRYAELFSFDDDTDTLYLDEVVEAGEVVGE